MNRKLVLVAVAALMVAATTLTTIAAARPAAAKQQVAIQMNPGGKEGFVLTPLKSGALSRDAGTVEACCWSSRLSRRYGLPIEVNDPLVTFTGKHGTLVTRHRVDWIDVELGRYAISIFTWKVIRGTGDYAGLVGGGAGASVDPPTGPNRVRLEGVLGPRQ